MKIERIEIFEAMIGKYLPTEFKTWLKETGFFTAPASATHHGNYEGGLFDHSMMVAETLVQLSKSNRLTWMNHRSAALIGMFHDLCKIDNYIITFVGSDGEVTFGYNKENVLPGHGDKSVIYLAQHMKLTPEEVMCIRWHMGAFDEKDNWQYFTRAVKQFPNVLWTHTADMIASQIKGV